LPTNAVTLSGSGTDADGTISSYKWNKLTGPAQFTIVSSTLAQTAVNGLVQGVYAFEMVVTDNSGALGRDTLQVTVNSAANILPKAIAGADQTITLPTNLVTLSGSGTDADGTIASYKWNKVTGPAQFTIVSSTLAQTAVNGMVQGVYTFELVVTDNNGAIGRDTLQVTVNSAGNIAPKAIAGADQTITLPTNAVTLSGSGTDADGTIASYKWNKISGPAQFAIVSSSAAQTAVNGLVQGVYAFELVVTDNNGALGRDTVKVTVLKDVEKGDYKGHHHHISVKLYPNPAISNITISFYEVNFFGPLRVQIYNSRGKVVLNNTLNTITDQFKLNVDVSSFHKGIYYVNFISNEKVLKVIRFIKL
jgi:K+-transporting ATPase c subunit